MRSQTNNTTVETIKEKQKQYDKSITENTISRIKVKIIYFLKIQHLNKAYNTQHI